MRSIHKSKIPLACLSLEEEEEEAEPLPMPLFLPACLAKASECPRHTLKTFYRSTSSAAYMPNHCRGSMSMSLPFLTMCNELEQTELRTDNAL